MAAGCWLLGLVTRRVAHRPPPECSSLTVAGGSGGARWRPWRPGAAPALQPGEPARASGRARPAVGSGAGRSAPVADAARGRRGASAPRERPRPGVADAIAAPGARERAGRV